MRIQSLQLKNFKRFTDLTLQGIPANAKLVLLIGSNGSGKSSVFDAFEYLSRPSRGLSIASDPEYYAKTKNADFEIIVNVTEGEQLIAGTKEVLKNKELAKKFYGRASLRIEPSISANAEVGLIQFDADAPERYTGFDKRFQQDVYQYIREINDALREPVFKGQQADTVKIFQQFIQPLNDSLRRVFNEADSNVIELIRFQDADFGFPTKPAKLIFKKGVSEINYDLLSHGEKQVVILLLNFIVRNKYNQDTVFFIDEMDVHLNTALQYNLLQEILNTYIPKDCQLWTASHSLGFIDYANEYNDACIFDLDDMDFDKPRLLAPDTKSNYEVFEIAVGKAFIDKIVQGRKLIFSENKDTVLYNDLALDNILFCIANDKVDAFLKAKNLKHYALVDRDFLADAEIKEIQSVYPFLLILPYYSIENLLYHPENLLEYYKKGNKSFDIKGYVEKILKTKNDEKDYLLVNIVQARNTYPFYKENEQADFLVKFRKNQKAVVDLLRSDDFESFYKVFPMKDYATQLAERQNLSKIQLSKTNWFKTQIENIIK